MVFNADDSLGANTIWKKIVVRKFGMLAGWCRDLIVMNLLVVGSNLDDVRLAGDG